MTRTWGRAAVAVAAIGLVLTGASGCTGGTGQQQGAPPANGSPATNGPPATNGSAPGIGAVRPGPDAVPQVDLTGLLPPDRQAVWDPGLNPVGGIPVRTRTCADLSPSGGDDTAAIQAALDKCPPNHVVQLESGDFTISGQGLYMTRSGITLRGRGWKTHLIKKPGSNYPVISVGIHWYHYTEPAALAADAPRGATTITLVRDPGLNVGEIVTLDEKTDPGLTVWNPDRSPP